MFICLAIKHCKELWRDEDRTHSGHLKSVRPEAAIKTLREQICRNPLWKQKIMSWKLNISTHSSRASSGMTYTRAHFRSKGHHFSPALKEIRRTRTMRLLQWHAENGKKNFLFRGEKMFTIKKQYNNQNNKIYAETSLQEHSEDAPSYVMVSWGVSHKSMTPFHFCEKGVKIVALIYQEVVLQTVVKPHNTTTSVVRNGSSSRTQLLPTRPRWLKNGCGGTFRPLSAPIIGLQGVKTSSTWTKNLSFL